MLKLSKSHLNSIHSPEYTLLLGEIWQTAPNIEDYKTDEQLFEQVALRASQSANTQTFQSGVGHTPVQFASY